MTNEQLLPEQPEREEIGEEEQLRAELQFLSIPQLEAQAFEERALLERTQNTLELSINRRTVLKTLIRSIDSIDTANMSQEDINDLALHKESCQNLLVTNNTFIEELRNQRLESINFILNINSEIERREPTVMPPFYGSQDDDSDDDPSTDSDQDQVLGGLE